MLGKIMKTKEQNIMGKCITCNKEITEEEIFGHNQCHDCWWFIAQYNRGLIKDLPKKF